MPNNDDPFFRPDATKLRPRPGGVEARPAQEDVGVQNRVDFLLGESGA